MWKNTLASVFLKGLFFIGMQIFTARAIYAQASTPIVRWELQVLQDGRLVDSFKGATPLGQSYTASHHYSLNPKRTYRNQLPELSNDENEVEIDKGNHQASELLRTITVMPNYIAPPLITFSLEAQEMLETTHVSSAQNCQPQPRMINASHPALTVSEGSWSNWQILKKKPLLTYRLRARVATP